MGTETRIILIVALFVLLMLSALFSAAETAYTSIDMIKIQNAANKGKRTSKLVEKHLNSFGWTLSTILIGNNIVNIASSTLVSYLLGSFMDQAHAAMLAVAVMTPLIVLFGEIIPKLLAKKYSWGYIKKVVWVLEILNWLFSPLTFLLSKMTLKSKVTYTEQELKTMITMASHEGVLQKGEARLAINALELDSTKVVEIMLARKNIVSIPFGTPKKDVMAIFTKTGFSRIPVMKNGKFVEIIHLKDVINPKIKKIEDLPKKEIATVSKNILISKALEVMRAKRTHLALVTKSSTSKEVVGIITIEDILETLIGKIYDEHDEKLKVIAVSLYKFRVNEHATMQELQDEIKFDFELKDPNQEVITWLKKDWKDLLRKILNIHIKVQ